MTLLLTLAAILAPTPHTDAADLPKSFSANAAAQTPTRRERWRRHREKRIRGYGAWLARVRRCESGGRYGIATGNGFYGAYQFLPSTWRAVGGKGMPHKASRLEQDFRAVVLRQRAGTSPWPVCGS